MYEARHPKADINHLSLRRDKSGRGTITVEEYVQMERRNLVEYLQSRIEKPLKAVNKE